MLTYFVSQNTSSQLQTGCASSWPCWHCAPPSSWILRCTTCCRCPWWDCWAHILCVYLVCLFVAVYMGPVLWLWSSVYSNALPSRVCVSTYSPFSHDMCNILFHLSKPTEAVIEPFLQGSLPLLASVCWFRCEVSKNWCLPSPFRMFGICCFNFMLLTSCREKKVGISSLKDHVQWNHCGQLCLKTQMKGNMASVVRTTSFHFCVCSCTLCSASSHCMCNICSIESWVLLVFISL